MTTTLRPTLRLLGDEEADRIVDEACAVLEQTGMRFDHQEARALLAEAGAPERDGRTRLPERLVRQHIGRPPARFEVGARDGATALALGDGRVHFDPGSAAIHLYDRERGARRAPTSQDVVDLARLVDGLPAYAAQSTAIVPGDVPPAVADRWRLYLALRHSKKPVVTGTFAKEGFAPMRAMLAAVRGGEDALAARPLAIFDCCPTAPLTWSDLGCQTLLDCARARIPTTLLSMPLAGATAPVTLRESVVQHTAENLSGLVLHQLAQPGAPLVWGGCPAAFDMRHGTTPVSAIESMMLALGHVEVGRRLGLPTHAYLGLSDSKSPDYQAGFETGMGAVLAALAGVGVTSGAGLLDFVNCQSFEKLVLDHDVCAAALRLARGMERRAEDAPALIAELVAAKQMLSHPHTRRNWRQELSMPSPLVDRGAYADWEAKGAVPADRRATAEVARRLAEPRPEPLPDDVAAALDEIMRGEGRRHGLDELPRLD